MRVLMLTQLFQPEPNHLKGLQFAQELARRGHSVEVLTGFPNYPGGKLYPGYRLRWRQREDMEGIPVTRVVLYPSHNRSGLGRFLCYSSLALSASTAISRPPRPDIVHVYQGPATLAWPAMLLQRRFGTPYVLDIQDLWPDSVTASGMMSSRLAVRILSACCQAAYRRAERIVVLSEGYRQCLIDRGVPEDRIDVVYNWCDERSLGAWQQSPHVVDPFGLAGRFNVIYAGNIGPVQALDSVIRAAALLAGELPNVQFVFVGDGVEVERLRHTATSSGLRNIRFIPRQPAERMPQVLDLADGLLIHLKDDPLSRMGIPQKTQAYLAAGRPILAAVVGDAAELVRRGQAGVVCRPEDADSIAEGVRCLARMSVGERRRLGDCGREFYRRELSFAVGVDRMESIFQRAAALSISQECRRRAA